MGDKNILGLDHGSINIWWEFGKDPLKTKWCRAHTRKTNVFSLNSITDIAKAFQVLQDTSPVNLKCFTGPRLFLQLNQIKVFKPHLINQTQNMTCFLYLPYLLVYKLHFFAPVFILKGRSVTYTGGTLGSRSREANVR